MLSWEECFEPQQELWQYLDEQEVPIWESRLSSLKTWKRIESVFFGIDPVVFGMVIVSAGPRPWWKNFPPVKVSAQKNYVEQIFKPSSFTHLISMRLRYDVACDYDVAYNNLENVHWTGFEKYNLESEIFELKPTLGSLFQYATGLNLGVLRQFAM